MMQFEMGIRMPAIGFVIRQTSENYVGELRTLTINASIELRPIGRQAESSADYVIYANGREIGKGWNRKNGKDRHYISLSIATPEFGAKPLIANLGPDAANPDPDRFAIIWNPE